MTKKKTRAIKKAFWSTLSRLFGMVMASGAGYSLIHLLGNIPWGYGLGLVLCILGFFLIWFAEYERENT